MPKTVADESAALSPGDFDEIERAVMETARGRWFLAEYARRLRHADSDAMLAAMAKLQAAIAANQDEIIQRLAQALETATAATPRPVASPQPLPERQMKYFRNDEDLFEPAAVAAVPSGLSHPSLRRLEAVAASQGQPEPREAPPPAAATVPSSAEPPRRRIVIIRHQPGEIIDVPLQHELAESA